MTKLMRLSIYLLIIIYAGISGCATLTPEQREEVEWRQAIDRENWRMCKMAYKQANKFTIHYDHRHHYKTDKVIGMSPAFAIRRDLIHNHCRMALAGYWADY